MKKIIFLLLFIPTFAFAQKPLWVSDAERYNNYPSARYLTGFAVNAGRNSAAFAESLKASAKAELIEGIRVSVQSVKLHSKSEAGGDFSESFSAKTLTFADAEISGLKMEYYYDANEQMGYAFAHADKGEVKGFYKSNIAFIIQKIESAISSAKQLESTNNKGKAKKVYEEAKPLFEELNFAQGLLTAIGSDEASLQIDKSLSLKADITSAISRMQSAIVVYVKSGEMNFNKPVKLLEPKLKALLSQRGCSFTPDPQKADWLLTIDASTREGREVDGIFFSYLDAAISLVERTTDKEIYSNNFTDLKGGGLDYETAGRKAYDGCLQTIANEIAKSLEK